MPGTRSDTSGAKDVFVPDHLMVMMDKPFGYVEPGKQHYGAPSDRGPVVPVVRSTVIAQLIGGAAAILEIVEAESTEKPILTTTSKTRPESGLVPPDPGRVTAYLAPHPIPLCAARRPP